MSNKQKPIFPPKEYHLANANEIIAIKAKINDVQNALTFYRNNLTGRTKIYVYLKDRTQITHLEITFANRNFMHLCGFKYLKGPKAFASDLKKNRLNIKLLAVKDDGSTFQKINIINSIKNFNTLNCKIDQRNPQSDINYSQLISSTNSAIAVAQDENGNNFPLSFLNTTVENKNYIDPKQVLAIVDVFQDHNVQNLIVVEKKNNIQAVKTYTNKLI